MQQGTVRQLTKTIPAPPSLKLLYHPEKHNLVAFMKVSEPHPPEPGEDGQHAARAAELAELLAHMTSCWDEERRLLARRLHDSLGSSMTALTMHLALLSQHLQEQPQRDRAA